VRLTDEQRAAAYADESSIAVVAGAGTGKTRVLTARYIHLVRDLGVDVGRILAVTFTEKAAREMKNRIRENLPPELVRRAEFAPVATIHGFLARLLREYALDAGLDPRFHVADEVTGQLLLEDALGDVLRTGYDAALVDLSGGEETLLSLYHAARATPHAMASLRWAEPDTNALRDRVRAFVDDAARESVSGKGVERLVRLREIAPRLLDLEPDACAEFPELMKRLRGDIFKRGRELGKEVGPLAILPAARATGAALVDALTRLDRCYTDKKRAEALLDFSDLERCGLDLLTRVDVCADAYDHLLVDEYQDTNRIQEAILDRLAAHCGLFGVGDEKQSIYRFRYADAGVFAGLQKRADGRYLLSGSFRTRPEVVAFTNELFAELFAGRDVAVQDLTAAAEWRDKDAPGVELLLAPGEHSAKAHRREAQAIACRLRAIVENKEFEITAADVEPRAFRYGDCALLVRARTHLALYERAFFDAGVPYVVIQGRGYYASREVVDLAHLLTLLGDPDDRYLAVSALTSLFCGVPDGDIAHLVALDACEPLPVRALAHPRPAAIPQERWKRLRTFARRFEGWRALAAREETADLIETIFAETRFADLLLLESDGRRRRANMHKALRRARGAQLDPAAFARQLLEFRERELRESEAPVASESDDVVKIMTVHAAKGLEFPLVCVADLTATVGGRSGPILQPDGSFTFRLRDGPDVPGREQVTLWDREQEQSERLRLLYVALTRAQEHLILSAAEYPRCNTEYLDTVRRLVEARPLPKPEARHRVNASVRAALRRGAALPAEVERDPDGARALCERIDAVRPSGPDTTPYVAAAADLVEFHKCPRRYRLGRMLGLEVDDPEGYREGGGSDEHPRRAQGTAFHAVMAEVGPGEVPDEETVRAHMPEANAADVRKIRGWAEWFAGQDLGRRLHAADCRVEMPFRTKVAGLPLQGVFDLYAPRLPLLLDYKTAAKPKVETDEIQVQVYLAALRALSFRVPSCGYLVYVDAERIVEVTEQPLLQAPLFERYLAAHRRDDGFEPQPGAACTYCDFRHACVRNGVACPPA